jgi:hypothetical protein
MASAAPEAFNDVTSGDGCCSQEYCCAHCFRAASGWDALTGLGTPNVDAWMRYIDNHGARARGVPFSRGLAGVEVTSSVPENQRVSIDDVIQFSKYYLIITLVISLIMISAAMGWAFYHVRLGKPAGYERVSMSDDDL